jgi:hypothetical protein
MLFTIRQTDFGIDIARSSWRIVEKAGMQHLTIEVYGDPGTYERIDASDRYWSWTLYPPHFYLRDFPVQKSGHVTVASLKEADFDDCDIALYLMEHWDLTDVRLEVGPESFRVEGRVSLFDDRVPFEIRWHRSD